MTLSEFMQQIASDTYPEPRSDGHDEITNRVAPMVAKLLQPFAHVLDVGCGQGPALEWFNNAGFTPTGLTLNMDDARVCQTAGHMTWIGDQNDMREAFGDLVTFDCVWARHVLEHSVAPYWTLHEFHRVLRPNGVLYVEVPSPDTACFHESNRNHYSVMGQRMWAQLILRAGFTIEQAFSINLQTPAGPDTYFSFICRKN
jgi:2-polyprenyl-3-methyl-5-hydroxy-6-metoxy-1,4-benzoquinol methylase